MDSLQRFLKKQLGWDFSVLNLEAGSDDEYAPVVVDL